MKRIRGRLVQATLLLASSLFLTSVAAQTGGAGANVSFAKAIITPSPFPGANSLAAGDIYHDGRDGLAEADDEGGGGVCSTLQSRFAAGVVPLSWICGQTGAFASSGVTFADVNLDGNLDILTSDDDDPLVVVGYGDGHGHFKDIPFLSGDCGYTTNQPVVADLNGDGIPDIVATVDAAGEAPGCVAVFLGQGDGTFAAVMDVNCGGVQPYSVAVGDLNHDGIPDLVVANNGDPFQGDFGNVAVLLGKGDGRFATPVSYPGLIGPFEVALGDFNNDGKLDLAVVATGNKDIYIALGKGDGTFLPATVYPLHHDAGQFVVADFNGDGNLDIAIPGTEVNPPYRSRIGVILGNGDGTFQRPALFPVDIGPIRLAVGDFNGDGKPDIAALGGEVQTISILLNTTTPWQGKPK
jgi:hypothetical protein